MNIEELATLVADDELDDLVIDLAMHDASEINNEGPEGQLTYACRRGVEMQELIDKVCAEWVVSERNVFDSLPQCGPPEFPEARLETDVMDNQGFQLFWHAVVGTTVEGGVYYLPADDCDEPRLLELLEALNQGLRKAKKLATNPKTGQKYIPVWIHEERQDQYKNPGQ